MSVLFFALGVRAVTDGEVPLRGRMIGRNEYPFVFWLCVLTLFGMGCFLASLGLLVFAPDA
jgi:hypothetical protein